MSNISITIDDRKLQAALKNLRHAAIDLTPAMRKIAQTLATVTEDNFAAQGRPQWKELADATKHIRIGGGKAYKKNGALKASARRLQEAGFRILQHTGGLASSIATDYDNHSALIGSNKVQAAIQQFGGQAERGKKVTIEARPYLPMDKDKNLQPEAKQDVLHTILRHLKTAVRI